VIALGHERGIRVQLMDGASAIGAFAAAMS
jgi:hypothetical protein